MKRDKGLSWLLICDVRLGIDERFVKRKKDYHVVGFVKREKSLSWLLDL